MEWNTTAAGKLNDIEAAHRGIGGTGRGRRFATEQINHAYAVLLASQFQKFCRDLHSECVDRIVSAVAPDVLKPVLREELFMRRTLDRGNANPNNIGLDFNRLGLDFWAAVNVDYSKNERRKQLLEELNAWRNAIAHQDFDPARLAGATILHLRRVRLWRRVCNRLAKSFDSVMGTYIMGITGTSPW